MSFGGFFHFLQKKNEIPSDYNGREILNLIGFSENEKASVSQCSFAEVKTDGHYAINAEESAEFARLFQSAEYSTDKEYAPNIIADGVYYGIAQNKPYTDNNCAISFNPNGLIVVNRKRRRKRRRKPLSQTLYPVHPANQAKRYLSQLIFLKYDSIFSPWYLCCVDGPAEGKTFELYGFCTSVGSSARLSNICVDDPGLQNKHWVLVYEEAAASFYAEPFGNTDIYVNASKIRANAKEKVDSGDVVHAGSTALQLCKRAIRPISDLPMLYLYTDGREKGVYRIARKGLTISRNPSSDICIEQDETVSRSHIISILYDITQDVIFLEHEGCINLPEVNGIHVRAGEKAVLHKGDTIRIGRHTELFLK